jgi:hypothetical protein
MGNTGHGETFDSCTVDRLDHLRASERTLEVSS